MAKVKHFLKLNDFNIDDFAPKFTHFSYDLDDLILVYEYVEWISVLFNYFV